MWNLKKKIIMSMLCKVVLIWSGLTIRNNIRVCTMDYFKTKQLKKEYCWNK